MLKSRSLGESMNNLGSGYRFHDQSKTSAIAKKKRRDLINQSRNIPNNIESNNIKLEEDDEKNEK